MRKAHDSAGRRFQKTGPESEQLFRCDEFVRSVVRNEKNSATPVCSLAGHHTPTLPRIGLSKPVSTATTVS